MAERPSRVVTSKDKYLNAPKVGAPTAFVAPAWLPAWVRIAKQSDRKLPLPSKTQASRFSDTILGFAKRGDDKIYLETSKWLEESRSDFRKWLNHSSSLRVPHHNDWWWRVQGDNPHLDAFELANIRLPGTLADNISVLALQAWTQGFRLYADLPKFLRHRFGGLAQLEEGMRLLHGDPWFQWALCHRRLRQGIIFDGVSVTESYRRIQYLTQRDPLSVTWVELEQIRASPLWLVALAEERDARARRDRFRPILGLGPWYHRVRVVRSGWTAGRQVDKTFKE